MDRLIEKANNVSDQKTMAEFLSDLANDYVNNGGEWENNDLRTFLNAMSSWVEDMDGYYQNNGQPYDEKKISWKHFADMLIASTMYE